MKRLHPQSDAGDPALRIASRPRLIRLVSWAVAIALLIVGGLIAPPWIDSLASRGKFLRDPIRMLRGLELAYLALASALLLGAFVLGAMMIQRGRGPRFRSILFRGVLAWLVSLLGLLLAEAGSAAWLAWTHRVLALPTIFLEQAGAPRLPDQLERAGTDVVSLVVVGESSAEGVPYREWLSVGRIVGWQLGKAIPGKKVRVEVQAESGTRLEQMHRKLAALRYRPDAIIIYAGHNEFYALHSWTHEVPAYYRDDQSSPLQEALRGITSRVSPLVRVIEETQDRILVSQPPMPAHRRLIDAPTHTPAEHSLLLADFRGRLEAIVAYCERIGALPVLVAPPGNDAGFEPNRSILPPETPLAEREAFARSFKAARALEVNEPDASLAAYRRLIDRQPGFAESHFRLARLLETRGEYGEAYLAYIKARDLDGHPFRCLTRFQDVYREIAARHHAILVDGQALFHARDPRGMLDDYLFNDGFHPSLEGHVALAEAILAEFKARAAFGWPAATPAPRIDLTDCARHFGVDTKTWEAVCTFAATFYHMTGALRYDRTERSLKRDRYMNGLTRIKDGQPADSLGLPGLGLRPISERGIPVPKACGNTENNHCALDAVSGRFPASQEDETAGTRRLGRILARVAIGLGGLAWAVVSE